MAQDLLDNNRHKLNRETVHFWPDAKYFDSPKFSLKALKHNLKAKAVLAAGLQIIYFDQINHEKIEWQFDKMHFAFLTYLLLVLSTKLQKLKKP